MIEVSVVMSVFNGAASLAETLASILDQEGCTVEFIIVNDGSTDASGPMLDEYAARDSRLRVIHQANTGLTRALVRGCAEAQGDFIARQDCGDISLPGRLARQRDDLRQHSGVAMVACAARFTGPGHEPLFVTSRLGAELDEGLAILDVRRLIGPPHHGGTMFRRSAYLQAGGYRPAFVVAQDIDLWLRLREFGQCMGDAFIGYEARMEAGSISASRRTDQLAMATLAVECARLRSQGFDDSNLVEASAAEPRAPVRRNDRLERARFFYFVASCLRQKDPRAARRYYLKAFRQHPLLAKSLVRYVMG